MPAVLDTRLPGESNIRSSPRRVVGIVVGALLGLAAVNAAALHYLRTTPKFLDYVTQRKWRLLAEQTRPVDWLILGDSTGLCGLDPEAVEREFGGRALNLCVTARSCAVADAWLLEEHIRRLGPPRGVIAVHHFEMWCRPISLYVVADMPAEVVHASAFRPACIDGLRSQLRLLWYRWVPLDSRTTTFARLLREGNQRGARTPYERRENGLNPLLEANPSLVRLGFAALLEHVRNEAPFKLSQDNQRAVERMVALADEYHFPLYFVSGPLYAPLLADEPFQSYLGQVQDRLTALCDRSPYAHCLLQYVPAFPIEQLQAEHHIIATGIEEFSQQTLARIRAVAALAGNPAAAVAAPRPRRGAGYEPAPAGASDPSR